MTPDHTALVVRGDRASLLLADGDFLILNPEGLPVFVLRKVEPNTAVRYVEAFGLATTETQPAATDER